MAALRMVQVPSDKIWANGIIQVKCHLSSCGSAIKPAPALELSNQMNNVAEIVHKDTTFSLQ